MAGENCRNLIHELLIQARSELEATLESQRKLRNMRGPALQEALKEAHGRAFERIDCLACANCCKTTPPIVTRKDAKRLAKALQIPPKTFIRKYLIEDLDGTSVMNGVPCTFLQADNTCAVYENRPEACRRYPHTDEEAYPLRPQLNTNNTTICPAAFLIHLDMTNFIANTK